MCPVEERVSTSVTYRRLRRPTTWLEISWSSAVSPLPSALSPPLRSLCQFVSRVECYRHIRERPGFLLLYRHLVCQWASFKNFRPLVPSISTGYRASELRPTSSYLLTLFQPKKNLKLMPTSKIVSGSFILRFQTRRPKSFQGITQEVENESSGKKHPELSVRSAKNLSCNTA